MKILNFTNTQPEKLSFIEHEKCGKYEQYYRQYACKPMDELDNGLVFKKIFFYLLQAAAYGLLIFGVISIFTNLFGSDGYFSLIENVDGGPKIIGILISLISITVSIAGLVFLYAIINNRSRKLFQKPFNGLLEYMFGHMLPTLIILLGEVLLVLFVAAMVGQLLGALTASPVYNPLAQIIAIFWGSFVNVLGIALFPIILVLDAFEAAISLPEVLNTIYLMQPVYAFEFSSFSDLGIMLNLTLGLLIAGVFSLISAYVVAEVYKYLYKVMLNLIAFIPKFAIPVAVRHRQEAQQEAEPATKNSKPGINLDEL